MCCLTDANIVRESEPEWNYTCIRWVAYEIYFQILSAQNIGKTGFCTQCHKGQNTPLCTCWSHFTVKILASSSVSSHLIWCSLHAAMDLIDINAPITYNAHLYSITQCVLRWLHGEVHKTKHWEMNTDKVYIVIREFIRFIKIQYIAIGQCLRRKKNKWTWSIRE